MYHCNNKNKGGGNVIGTYSMTGSFSCKSQYLYCIKMKPLKLYCQALAELLNTGYKNKLY